MPDCNRCNRIRSFIKSLFATFLCPHRWYVIEEVEHPAFLVHEGSTNRIPKISELEIQCYRCKAVYSVTYHNGLMPIKYRHTGDEYI